MGDEIQAVDSVSSSSGATGTSPAADLGQQAGSQAASAVGEPATAPSATETGAAGSAGTSVLDPTDTVDFSDELGEEMEDVTVQPWGSGTNDSVWNSLKSAGWSDQEIAEQGLVDKVAQMNNLENPDVVQIGQHLKIPTRDDGAGSEPAGTENRGAVAPTKDGGVKQGTPADGAPGVSADKPADNGTEKPADTTGKVQNPLGSYTVTQEFGLTDFATTKGPDGYPYGVDGNGNPKPHAGMDLAAAEGEPVHAVKDGVVTQKGNDQWKGNWVEIRHDDGTTTRYLHMSSFGEIEVGQAVSAGTSIGAVGSTGMSTGNHLHFQYNDAQGNPTDPRQLLPGL